MKKCSKCLKVLPLTEFGVNRARADGLHHRCKDCHKKVNKKWSKENPEKVSAIMKKWRGLNPERVKADRDKYFNEHRGEYAARATAWLKSHPEAKKAYTATYRARLKLAEGKHTAAEMRDLMKKQKGRCVFCKCDIRDRFSGDHIVALSRGGSNFISNIQLTCMPCNSKKSTSDQIDFMRKNGFLL